MFLLEQKDNISYVCKVPVKRDKKSGSGMNICFSVLSDSKSWSVVSKVLLCTDAVTFHPERDLASRNLCLYGRSSFCPNTLKDSTETLKANQTVPLSKCSWCLSKLQCIEDLAPWD